MLYWLHCNSIKLTMKLKAICPLNEWEERRWKDNNFASADCKSPLAIPADQSWDTLPLTYCCDSVTYHGLKQL